MLKKLLKQEFLATTRVMGILYLVMLVLAMGSQLLVNSLGELGELVRALILLLAMACGLATVPVMIVRFKQNLLGDEGYLMLTLPVSVHQHLWSKLIVSAAWSALSALMTTLALNIIRYGSEGADMPLISINGTPLTFGGDGLLVAELVVLGLVGVCTICLQFYAALAAGHGFSRHKMLLSAVWFVGLNAATSLLIELLPSPDLHFRGNLMADVHQAVWLIIAGTAAVGAAYYAITVYCLQRHLNLS